MMIILLRFSIVLCHVVLSIVMKKTTLGLSFFLVKIFRCNTYCTRHCILVLINASILYRPLVKLPSLLYMLSSRSIFGTSKLVFSRDSHVLFHSLSTFFFLFFFFTTDYCCFYQTYIIIFYRNTISYHIHAHS